MYTSAIIHEMSLRNVHPGHVSEFCHCYYCCYHPVSGGSAPDSWADTAQNNLT